MVSLPSDEGYRLRRCRQGMAANKHGQRQWSIEDPGVSKPNREYVPCTHGANLIVTVDGRLTNESRNRIRIVRNQGVFNDAQTPHSPLITRAIEENHITRQDPACLRMAEIRLPNAVPECLHAGQESL